MECCTSHFDKALHLAQHHLAPRGSALFIQLMSDPTMNERQIPLQERPLNEFYNDALKALDVATCEPPLQETNAFADVRTVLRGTSWCAAGL